MLKHPYIDRISLTILALAIVATLLFMNGDTFGLRAASRNPGYVDRLFDPSRVHRIELFIEDKDAFFESATEEEYISCTVIIDGEAFKHIGLRAKGNNSLRLTEKCGLTRYSLKLEFDHYVAESYHGLDKFSLDSSFQDNSYMKTRLTFDMMRQMGVATPLCSYAWVTINGEDHGLFLAIEEPEEAFAKRNYGKDHGLLYKPDYRSLEDENADVALRYTDDEFASYDNIFRNAKFRITDADKRRLIASLKTLSSGKALDTVIDTEQVLRYFTVQVFVVNMDSYLGKTGHNYFLYEKDGVLSMIPWDYNLAFATYSLGMPNPINDSTLYVNYPIDTPAAFDIMSERPMYHQLMKDSNYYLTYHLLFDQLIESYFESGYFEHFVEQTADMIAPYVRKDPTAFCSFEDYQKAVETITEFCRLRAMSIRGQLDGSFPSTFREQEENPDAYIDASSVWLPDMGELADLKSK